MSDKISYIGRIIISLCLLCLCLSGCRERQPDQGDAADAAAKKELLIGVTPEQNVFRQRERFALLAEYLSQRLGVRFELNMAASYGSLIDGLGAQELDGAFLGSFAGAVAVTKLAAQPLARMQYPDGTSTYQGVIFARKDSGIATARDMQNKTFVFVDRKTTAGWLFPLHYFKDSGIDAPFSWLGETYFAGTHEDAILDVLNRRADAGAAKDTIFFLLAKANSKVAEELVILATSPPVPANALLVGRDVDASLKKKLRETLLAMHLDDDGAKVLKELGVKKFVKTSIEDYSQVIAYAEEVGMDASEEQNSSPLSH